MNLPAYKIDDKYLFAEMTKIGMKYFGEPKKILDCNIVAFVIETIENGEGQKPILPIDTKLFTQEVVTDFEKYITQTAKCIRLAEFLFDNLKSFVSLYLRGKSPAVLDKKFADVDLKKADFMKHRDILSTILNTDKKFQIIKEVNAKESLTLFTKTFYDFILNRNNYTHGKLFFHYPKMNCIVRVFDTVAQKQTYNSLSHELIAEYFSSYDFLAKILQKIHDIELDDFEKELSAGKL